MDQPNVTVLAEDLLTLLVAAWDDAPPGGRISFGVDYSVNGRMCGIHHPGLPDKVHGTNAEILHELVDAGLIKRHQASPYSRYQALYSLTSKGHRYVNEQGVMKNANNGPRLFIVHGHDEQTMLRVKNFLQNRLKLPEPVVLHEQPSQGRTIIEKFEEHAAEVDGAVVLLTPDDRWQEEGRDDELRRARQNVVFELGYFYGKMGRRSGSVMLLYKGVLDLPSDISGIIYIDISNGIEQAGELIRRELPARVAKAD